MSSLVTLAPLAVVVLLSGMLIGCVGIGGVLLVPALAYIGNVDVHLAIASVMLSYLFTGVLGTILYARRGSITWTMNTALCAGAMPGAFAGAALVHAVPGTALELLIGLLVMLSGLHSLRGPADAAQNRSQCSLMTDGVALRPTEAVPETHMRPWPFPSRRSRLVS